MKNFIKTSGRILFDYLMALIVFAVFFYAFLSITKDNFGKWIDLYSVIIFLLLFYIVYSEMKNLAIKEKKPQYELNPYPLKGLLYGLVATIPVAAIVGIAALIPLNNEYADRLKHLAINAFLGPLYFLVRWLGESPVGYAAAILMLPLITMLGYLAGHYGINILGRFKKNKPIEEKGFKKSPWNPSNNSTGKTRKKKSSSKKTTGGI